MLALINTPNYEEVMNDINNTVFSVVEKPMSYTIWNVLEEQAQDGATEMWLYDEMRRLIQSNYQE